MTWRSAGVVGRLVLDLQLPIGHCLIFRANVVEFSPRQFLIFLLSPTHGNRLAYSPYVRLMESAIWNRKRTEL